MPDTLEKPAFLFGKYFLRTLIVAALGLVLAGCSSPRPIERGDVVFADTPADGRKGRTETAPYPEHVAGTVSELYGPGGEAEQSPGYRSAVAINPLLRYVIIYFDFNSSEIRSESQEVLLEHADYLMQNPDVTIRIEGHADKRGSSGYNLSLGERRALTVQSFLRAHNVRSGQMSAISYGEERPAARGDSEAVYAKNRRVELVYR